VAVKVCDGVNVIVGVGVIVGVNVIVGVGVRVWVGVPEGIGVDVGKGVFTDVSKGEVDVSIGLKGLLDPGITSTLRLNRTHIPIRHKVTMMTIPKIPAI